MPIQDFGRQLIIPGLVDLHVHAPQYSYRGMHMDLELLDWLNCYTFPEEARYADADYARRRYPVFVDDLRKGATTRACIFATVHVPATEILMDLLERSGLRT
ncbi:MAG: amidohydrolase family protein, partial [Lachnospiraceae bacterium]|nr:amidohydrolase family protein [Lachnospiraceae bacterium]